MAISKRIAVLLAFGILSYACEASDLFFEGADAVVLRGPAAKHQVLVTAKAGDGTLEDFTRKVSFTAEPPGIVRVTSGGLLIPLANGRATVRAVAKSHSPATMRVEVVEFAHAQPINFANEIVPILTKGGCNGGGCHGKSGGQNGFRLSLLGFEPGEDYEHLVKEARGRRLFPAAPERSLLLLKGAAILPHGGGKRLDPASDDYKLLHRWIASGMPAGKATDPQVQSIDVSPRERTLTTNAQQQLVVLANYTDGSVRDVTRSALFEPNDKDVARTDDNGLVTILDRPGDVAVMVRYQSKVGVFRGIVPLGATVTNLPLANNFVDELVFKKLKKVGIPPSKVCDDSTFLRRATIDIAGRLPTPDETRAFLADTNTGKRERWIDQLVDSPDYADYFANKWSALLRNKRSDAIHARGTHGFHGWIRDSLLEDKPYDRLVREVLIASGEMRDNPPVAWYRQVRDTTAQLEDTAQLFLGQRLQCAQCHHHPYEKWSQQDYYSFAAFFSQVGRKGSGQPGEEIIFARHSVPAAENKKTKQQVKPAGLGAKSMDLPPEQDARQVLADWMTRKENPFFARSLVNRYWKHFMGRGLVEPEDDLRETNPPTNGELLDALAQSFVGGGYSLKAVVRTICKSTVYQLSAIPNEANQVDRHNFSRFYPRRLHAEVLLDAVDGMAGSQSGFNGLPAGTRAVQLPDNSFNVSSYFLNVFGRPEASTSCECERSGDASLAQSLHLLNAKDIQEKIAGDKGMAATLSISAPTSDEHNVKELYARAFAREPDSGELATATEYLKKATVGKEAKELTTARRQAYEDIIWALVNTKEFLFNH